MTLTFELAIDVVKMNQRAKYVVQKLLSGRTDMQIHTPDWLLYLDP